MTDLLVGILFTAWSGCGVAGVASRILLLKDAFDGESVGAAFCALLGPLILAASGFLWLQQRAEVYHLRRDLERIERLRSVREVHDLLSSGGEP